MKKSIVSALALTLGALGLSPVQAADAAAAAELAARAQQALVADMGEQARDIAVTVDQDGVATLQGWARQPRDVAQARYVVSRVPGIHQAYGSAVHTWSSTDRY